MVVGDKQVDLGVQCLSLLVQGLIVISKLLLALFVCFKGDDLLAQSFFLRVSLLFYLCELEVILHACNLILEALDLIDEDLFIFHQDLDSDITGALHAHLFCLRSQPCKVDLSVFHISLLLKFVLQLLYLLIQELLLSKFVVSVLNELIL